MSGLGMILNIAQSALAAQQYGMNVTAHNIANVNTPGYTRQSSVFAAKQPSQSDGMVIGRGVDTDQIVRTFDQFVENQLMREKADMLSSKEMENYMRILEGIFSENSENSISAMLSKFWNLWSDISNNPSGIPERIALYEHGLLLSEQFNNQGNDLKQLEADLTNAVSVGVEKINQITSEIAHLNEQIVRMEVNSSANDLRDKRNALVSELSEYIDVKSFAQDSGALSIITVRGCTLVHENKSFEMEMGGGNGDRVGWLDSSGVSVDITNYITKGKLGGWLDMRDKIVAKYKLDLDALAKEFVFSVNSQHSQGVGLKGFSTVTGTYGAASTSASLNSSGLAYADEIVDGGFRLWLYDANGNYDSDTTISIDADFTSIDAIVAAVNAIDPAKISATTVDGTMKISGINNYTFAFSDDTGNVLSALGMNTFFTGVGAMNLGINDAIGLKKELIAAAEVFNNVGAAVASSLNSLSATGTILTSGRHTGGAEASYELRISNGGAVGVAEFQWRKDGGAWSAPVATTGGIQLIGSDGVAVQFMPGAYVLNDTFTIEATADSSFYGSSASGDNTNALAMCDLKYTSRDITQWTCDRIEGDTEGMVTAPLEDYYHAMVGSIGVISSSISRSSAFSEVMVNEISSIRDGISAVSLDEEMANLIRFQHAYTAATKLISTSDEMLDTLLKLK